MWSFFPIARLNPINSTLNSKNGAEGGIFLLPSTYGFRFTDALPQMMLIQGIGWETVTDAGYDWNGLLRRDQGLLFQYTLSGEGRLIAEGKHYTLPKQHGFLVTLPGDHRYYYDPSSDKPWEFVWIMAGGEDAYRYWRLMTRKAGPVVQLRPESAPLELFWGMYKDISDNVLRDPYEVSLRLYEWVLSVLRAAEGRPQHTQLPKPVEQAKHFMDTEYAGMISLDEIAAAAGLSKHHFCRMFVKSTGMRPIDYLRKKRIEEAARALRHTDLPIGVIAKRTGFDNSSYFGKVFRQLVGLSPQQFREGNYETPVNELFIE
jgi:AraC-like DNA-binding protein